jgi:hypothetical protein
MGPDSVEGPRLRWSRVMLSAQNQVGPDLSGQISRKGTMTMLKAGPAATTAPEQMIRILIRGFHQGRPPAKL